ncbi:MAG: PstS family phosphate ABC transporter substrate-binding protein [Cyanobacteriota bacterium]|nr:PstS family phosphate ABC transporter substrate-binding protein [Cyanobacteriota bacterium]
MSQKKETTTLAIALLMTLGLIGGGVWLFGRQLMPGRSPNPASPQTASNDGSTYETLAQVPAVPEGLFNYGGSTTWAPLRGEVDPILQAVWPKFQLRYTDPVSGTPGSGSGIRMLLDDQLAFSQSSRSLKDEEYERAEQRGFLLRQIPVAIDGIAIAVHPELDVTGVTIAQLKDIYTGKIANWSEVGGPDLPITAYSRRPEDGGTVEFFIDNVLEEEELGTNVEFAFNTTDALRRVGENLGGIYYASAPEVVPQCSIKPLAVGRSPDRLVAPYQEPFVPPQDCPDRRNQLNAAAFQSGDYPITRRLFVIVKQNGQIDERAGEAYAQLLLTSQGQELITEAGFVSIR